MEFLKFEYTFGVNISRRSAIFWMLLSLARIVLRTWMFVPC